jgi:hypothetical protein
VVRFVTFEPRCQCQVVTSLASDLDCGTKSSACFGLEAASGTTGRIVPAVFATDLSK